jgi:hypothetical protein
MLYGQMNDRWIYPIRPDMPEWKSFKTHEEKVAACQIPEVTLKKMSTENLIYACLDNPFYGYITAYSNCLVGFERFVSQFNCFDELSKRNDYESVILNTYKEFVPNSRTIGPEPLALFKFHLDYKNIDLLISHNKFITKLSLKTKVEILKENLVKLKQKTENVLLNSPEYLQTTYFLMAKILQSEKYSVNLVGEELDMYNTFLLTSSMPDLKLIIPLEIAVLQFIKTNEN